MGNGVDHYVEYGCCKDSLSVDLGKMWLSLSAQTHLPLDILTADLLAKGRVLCQNAEGEKTKFCIMRDSRRAIRMVEQIGCQREEA